MKKSELKAKALEIYKERGLLAMENFISKNSKKYNRTVIHFGLENISNAHDKMDWLETQGKNEIRVHYYSVGVRSRKTGFSYNKMRALLFEL